MSVYKANETNANQAVNAFLNGALTSSDPATGAANVLPIAMDEPIQLMTLKNLLTGTDQAGLQNSINLMQNFPTVPKALMNIAASNNDPNIVLANVAVINSIRCGTVLQNIGGLWENVLNDNGLNPVAFPPGPAVCPTARADGVYTVLAPLLQN